jgi:hypothetical protein
MPDSRATEDRRRRERTRSRSPHRESHSERRHKSSRRSRSPRRDDDRHRRKKHRSRSPVAAPVILPYKAKPLSRHKFDEYRPLFQSYLDIQKQIQLDDLDEREAKGRWKSFTSRWYVHCLSWEHGKNKDDVLTSQESWRLGTQLVRSLDAEDSTRNRASLPRIISATYETRIARIRETGRRRSAKR